MRRSIPWLFALTLTACSDPNGSTDASPDAADVVVPIDGLDASDAPSPLDVIDVSSPDTGADVSIDTVANDGACMQITNDPSAIGNDCGASGAGCPAGYTCQSMSGIVLQQRCEVICRSSCECPASYVCNSHADKAGSWMQCDAP